MVNSKTDLIARIKRLNDFLYKHRMYSHIRLTAPEKDTLWFSHHVANRDGAMLGIRQDGKVELHSWLESYHNGDPYDNKENILDENDELRELSNLEARLISEANNAAANYIKDRVRQEEEMLAKKMVSDYLSENGI